MTKDGTAPSGIGTKEMIFGFRAQHAIGSVCGLECPQCDFKTGTTNVVGTAGVHLSPDTPFYILRAATREEWAANVKARGGKGTFTLATYFYAVTTD